MKLKTMMESMDFRHSILEGVERDSAGERMVLNIHCVIGCSRIM